MGRQTIVVGFVAIFTVIIALLPANAVYVTKKGEIIPQMELVVTVDGKSYFADYQPFRVIKNWTDAQAHCESLDLTLASVTSMAQFDALNISFANYFDGSFWTSGRDALSLRQFSWNVSDEQPSEAYRYRNTNAQVRTCLAYYSAFVDSFFFPLSCASEAGTLCET